jgi:nitrogen regulatory protein P-II 1
MTMKEIKAFVKIIALEEVVAALRQAHFSSMSIIDVSGLGALTDPGQSKYSLEFAEKMSTVAKIELACRDGDVDRVVDIIKTRGCTHEAGDGIILVSPVERAVRIRTGEEGETILQANSGAAQ